MYTWIDGRVHSGHWKNGKPHGKGTFTDKDGKVKSGTWVNGDKQNILSDETDDESDNKS